MLCGATKRLGVSVKCARISPKALAYTHMFGEFDPHTAEWHDGVVSKVLRYLTLQECFLNK